MKVAPLMKHTDTDYTFFYLTMTAHARHLPLILLSELSVYFFYINDR